MVTNATISIYFLLFAPVFNVPGLALSFSRIRPLRVAVTCRGRSGQAVTCSGYKRSSGRGF